jgi:hypothetical protein
VQSGTLTITIPSGAVIGDYAIIALTSDVGDVFTIPSGWTQMALSPFSGVETSVKMTVWYKTIATGNPGSVVTVARTTGTNCVCAVMGVYSGVGVTSVQQVMWESSNTETVNNKPMRCPSLVGGPYDLKVGITSTYSYSTVGPAQAALTAAPTGCTIRETGNNNDNALAFGKGVGLFDGPATTQHETCTFTTNCHMIGVILSLGPSAAATAQIEKAPASLAGKSVLTYGRSYCCDVSVPETNSGWNTRRPWNVRVTNALGNVAGSNNIGMCGSWVADQCTAAYGSHANPTRAVSGDTNCVTQAGTFTAQTAPGLVLIEPFANDLLNEGTNPAGRTRMRAGALNSLDALVRLVRSSSVKAYNDASVAYAGTWATASSDGCSGGVANLSTTPGSTVTITTTQQNLDLILIGSDNSGLSTTGAPFSVQVDGVTVGTGSCHNTMVSTGGGGGLFVSAYTNYQFCQFAFPIRNLSVGTHTIVITHTGSSGDRLMFNCWLQPAATPPWVVINGVPPFPAATYTAHSFSASDAAAYTAMAYTVASSFSDGRVIVYDPTATNLLPTTEYASDNVHGLEIWHAYYAHEVMRRMNECIP